jgi:hypothetical protein
LTAAAAEAQQPRVRAAHTHTTRADTQLANGEVKPSKQPRRGRRSGSSETGTRGPGTGDGARCTAKLRPCAATFVLSHPSHPLLHSSPSPLLGALHALPFLSSSLPPSPPPVCLSRWRRGWGSSFLNPPPPESNSGQPNQQPRPACRQTERLIGGSRGEEGTGYRIQAQVQHQGAIFRNRIIMPSCPGGRRAKGSFLPHHNSCRSLARICSSASSTSGFSPSNPTLLVPRSATAPRRGMAIG